MIIIGYLADAAAAIYKKEIIFSNEHIILSFTSDFMNGNDGSTTYTNDMYLLPYELLAYAQFKGY